MRLGVVILPEHGRTEWRRRWRRAEELGFAHAWTYDHLAWRTLRDGPWHATMPMLAAAALETRTIGLGTLVASPNVRHPVTFAKDVMTLDELSAGRVIAGIGAGGTGWDATMLGQEPLAPAERSARFADFVALADVLLREGKASYRGRYYKAVEARALPGCVQRPRPPFAIAATGARGMRLAARYGQWWVTTGEGDTRLGLAEGAAVVRRQVDALETACREEGRDPATLGRIVLTGLALEPGLGSAAAFAEARAAYAAAGVTDMVVHWPRPSPPFEGDEALFAAVVGTCIRSLPSEY